MAARRKRAQHRSKELPRCRSTCRLPSPSPRSVVRGSVACVALLRSISSSRSAVRRAISCEPDVERHCNGVIAGVRRVVADGARPRGKRTADRIVATSRFKRPRCRSQTSWLLKIASPRAIARRSGGDASLQPVKSVNTVGIEAGPDEGGAGAGHDRQDVQRIVDADAEGLPRQRPRPAMRPGGPETAGVIGPASGR